MGSDAENVFENEIFPSLLVVKVDCSSLRVKIIFRSYKGCFDSESKRKEKPYSTNIEIKENENGKKQ